MATEKKKQSDATAQLQRFKDMAKEVGADESPGALDRAFRQVNPKKQATGKKAKRQ